MQTPQVVCPSYNLTISELMFITYMSELSLKKKQKSTLFYRKYSFDRRIFMKNIFSDNMYRDCTGEGWTSATAEINVMVISRDQFVKKKKKIKKTARHTQIILLILYALCFMVNRYVSIVIYFYYQVYWCCYIISPCYEVV